MRPWLALFILIGNIAAADTQRFMSTEDPSATRALISYLQALYDEGEIRFGDLPSFESSLINDEQVMNPFGWNGSSSQRIHARELDRYLHDGQVKRDDILRWVREMRTLEEAAAIQRQAERDRTLRVDQRIEFKRIAKGAYRRGHHKVILRHDFEIMTTTVTNRMWTDLLKLPPVGRHKRNLPRVGMTWVEAAQFANALSRARGLDEVYLLRDDKFIGVRDVDQNVYATEGYRLPTVDEYLYVMSGRGTHAYGKFPGVNEQTVANFAWCGENSDDHSHDVASLQPCTVDGQFLFDLLGNVWQWSHDSLRTKSARPERRTCAVLLGSDFRKTSEVIFKPDLMIFMMVYASRHAGLRLVRSLK